MNRCTILGAASATVGAPDQFMPPPVSAAVRRDLFGAFGAVLLLSAVEAGSAKAAELDGELLACCAEAHRLDGQSDALCLAVDDLPEEDARVEAAYEKARALMLTFHAVVKQAEVLPARTPEGLRARRTWRCLTCATAGTIRISHCPCAETCQGG